MEEVKEFFSSLKKMEISKEYKRFSKPLGRGGFSEIYKATHLMNGKVYALKLIKVTPEA